MCCIFNVHLSWLTLSPLNKSILNKRKMGRHPFNKKYNLIYIKGSFFKVKGEKAKLFPSPNKRCTLS